MTQDENSFGNPHGNPRDSGNSGAATEHALEHAGHMHHYQPTELPGVGHHTLDTPHYAEEWLYDDAGTAATGAQNAATDSEHHATARELGDAATENAVPHGPESADVRMYEDRHDLPREGYGTLELQDPGSVPHHEHSENQEAS